MMDSIEKAGFRTQIHAIPASIGSANGASGTVRQTAARPSLTVTSGGANKAATLVERDSADGRRKAKIMSGEPLVSNWDFEGGATGRTHIDG